MANNEHTETMSVANIVLSKSVHIIVAQKVADISQVLKRVAWLKLYVIKERARHVCVCFLCVCVCLKGLFSTHT